MQGRQKERVRCGHSKGKNKLSVHIIPIGAWMCNFPSFLEIMTDSPTDRPKDGGYKGS